MFIMNKLNIVTFKKNIQGYAKLNKQFIENAAAWMKVNGLDSLRIKCQSFLVFIFFLHRWKYVTYNSATSGNMMCLIVHPLMQGLYWPI